MVHVTAESYNEEIPAGGSIDFGYNLSASDVKPVRCTLMIAGKEVTTVAGEKAAQTDGQSVDSDKKISPEVIRSQILKTVKRR